MINISFDAGVVVGNKLFLSEKQFNALLEIELDTGEVRYVGCFSKEKEICTDLHRKALKYENSIIFIPQRAKYIALFNLDSYEISFVDIQRKNRIKTLFSDCFIDNGTLWLFPAVIEQSLLKIDLKTKEIMEEKNFNQKLCDVDVIEAKEMITKVCKVRDQVYFVILNTSKVVCYDTKTQEVFINKTKIQRVNTIFSVGKELWVSNQSGYEIYLYNPDTRSATGNEIITWDVKRGSNHVIPAKNGDVFLIPDYGREVLKMNKKSKVFERQEEMIMKSGAVESRGLHYLNFDYWGNKIVLFPGLGDPVVIIDNNQLEELNLWTSDEKNISLKRCTEALKTEIGFEIIREKSIHSLDIYINSIIANI